ncbi:MAG: bacteriohemerythrin [Chitinivibrionales bacterium]|nr:bacteriohemerythrin [Chitinivibrionales bacterium]
MALMEWSDSYSVSIASIDEQHKKLVGMVNALNEAMATGKSKEGLQKTLTELINYTVEHFSYEERLFAQHGYLETVKHAGEHKKLAGQVLDFDKKFKAGELMLSIQMMNFLKDWLITHIGGSDKKYSGFLISKGVK